MVLYVMTARSEEIRIRYKYRQMILNGKARISLDSARALVGPDSAYHLYGLLRRSRRSPRNLRFTGPTIRP